MFGAYNLLSSYMAILFGISSFGVGIYAKRWLPSTEDLVERARIFYPQFWFQVLSVTILGCLSAFVYVNLGKSLKDNFNGFSGWMIPVYLVAYTVYSRSTDYFRYTHRTGMFNVSTVAQPYLFVILALGIFWIYKILNTGSLFVSLIFACVTIGGLMLLIIRNEIGIHFQKFKTNELFEEIKLGFPLVLVYLVDLILSSGDRYIIAAMLTIRDVGNYVPAYQLGMLVMVLPKVFGIVLHPIVSSCVDNEDAAGAKVYFDTAVHVFLLFSIPYVLGTAILGEEVLRLYASEEVAEASWVVMPIVAFASIFYGLTLIKANILFVRLNTTALFYINLICASVNILLNIILIKLFGNVIVVGLATLASYLVSYLLLRQKLNGDPINYSYDGKGILHILFCSGVMVVVVLMILFSEILKSLGLAGIVFLILMAVVTYFALTFSRPLNRVGLHKLIQSMRFK
jgi:O-antigen/teichoic acid export membrane protein